MTEQKEVYLFFKMLQKTKKFHYEKNKNLKSVVYHIKHWLSRLMFFFLIIFTKDNFSLNLFAISFSFHFLFNKARLNASKMKWI